jgi:hypothetical protein
MHMPGFTAEASLYKPTECYQQSTSSIIEAGGAVKPTSAQAAPAFATGGVLVRVAEAPTAAFLIDRNCQPCCAGVWKFPFLVTSCRGTMTVET